jgi:hypothetical protein
MPEITREGNTPTLNSMTTLSQRCVGSKLSYLASLRLRYDARSEEVWKQKEQQIKQTQTCVEWNADTTCHGFRSRWCLIERVGSNDNRAAH